jgi:hypothetical protein
MTEQFPWLTTIILIPAIAALLIPFFPDKDGKLVRWYALGVGLADFILICYAFWHHYDPSQASFQMVEKVSWIPRLGISWALSVDGLSAPLVLLSGLVTTLSMFAAWQVDRRPRLFYALMLLLYAAQVGVFAAQDLMLFFIMWEVELVPVYLLISIWGGQNRAYAATKFLIYTALASIFILVAGLGLALYGDNITFDIAELQLKQFPLVLELLLYAGLLVAFGVKLAIFPFHTWLADAHGEASSPVSMVLAGVLLKMGLWADAIQSGTIAPGPCLFCTNAGDFGRGQHCLWCPQFLCPDQYETAAGLFLYFPYGVCIAGHCLLHRPGRQWRNAANALPWANCLGAVLPGWGDLRSHPHHDDESDGGHCPGHAEGVCSVYNRGHGLLGTAGNERICGGTGGVYRDGHGGYLQFQFPDGDVVSCRCRADFDADLPTGDVATGVLWRQCGL